jgi:hypothetical protein
MMHLKRIHFLTTANQSFVELFFLRGWKCFRNEMSFSAIEWWHALAAKGVLRLLMIIVSPTHPQVKLIYLFCANMHANQKFIQVMNFRAGIEHPRVFIFLQWWSSSSSLSMFAVGKSSVTPNFWSLIPHLVSYVCLCPSRPFFLKL